MQARTTSWDQLIIREDLEAHLTKTLQQQKPLDAGSFAEIEKLLLPPIGSQEVWASGVTYYRSRNARMEEAKTAGGGDFYERVYVAERPELFMKATPIAWSAIAAKLPSGGTPPGPCPSPN